MKPFIRHKRKSLISNITPLLDVMFMLLLFFLLTSSFLNPSIPLNLPEAKGSDVKRRGDITVSLTKDGELFVNSIETSLEEFDNILDQELSKSEKKSIIFYGDENILYKRFVSVMAMIKKSDAREISIAHDIQ